MRITKTQPPTFTRIDELAAKSETVILEIKEQEAGIYIHIKRKEICVSEYTMEENLGHLRGFCSSA